MNPILTAMLNKHTFLVKQADLQASDTPNAATLTETFDRDLSAYFPIWKTFAGLDSVVRYGV